MAQKHPKGLYVLFFTEMWERFGYYLMIAIFTLYLQAQGMSEGEASNLYGSFIALVYLSPLLGGYLADKHIGYSRSVTIGATLLAAGYLLLMTSHLTLALGIIILGNGFFKPNISTLVSNLYPQGDRRRDSAFSIFYMGVNVGSLFSPFAASYMRNRYGWGPAFGTAGVGMLFGLLTFITFRKHLIIGDRHSSLGAVVNMPLPLEYNDQPDPPAVERSRIRALVIMCIIVMLFWVAFHQNGSTLTYFARDNTDLTVGGWLLSDPEKFAAINPFFVIVLTPFVVNFFNWLRRYGLEPSTPAKLGLGMLMTAASFLVLVGASLAGGDTGRVSPWWLIASYFVGTIGELCLSPVGLSMMTKSSPRRYTSLMLGVWYLSTSIGNKISGYLGVYWKNWYHHNFFALLVLSSLAAATTILLLLPRLKAAMPKEGPAE